MALTPNVYLFIDVPNKRARVVDETNYSEEGIVLSAQNARGLGTVIYGSGDTTQVVFNGASVSNPLVNLASSINGQWFNLPLDSNGEILNGTYSFNYSVRYAGSASIDTITAPSTAVLEFTSAGRVLQAGDSIVFAGNAQGANNGTFTIATATFNVGSDNSTITVTQTTLVNAPTPTGTFSYDVTRTNFAAFSDSYTGCDEVKPKVTTTIDCDSTQFGTIIFKEDTNLEGQTLVSRALTGFYPNGLNPAPATESVTTSQSSLTFSELAVGTWTYVLTLNINVTQAGGLVYGYTLRDTNEVKVTCVGALCSITPCLENLSTAIMNTYKTGASNLIPVLTTVNTLINLANAYKECGEDEKYKQTVQEIHDVLDSSGCTCGCDEGQDVPYWVNNAGFSAQTLLDQLVADVAALETTVASQITNIFTGRQFYGDDTYFNNTPIPFSAISSLAIPTGFLDFPTTNGYGKKSIEIDIIAATGSSGANTQVRLTSGEVGTTIYSSTFGGDSGTQNTKLVLTIEKNGTDNNLWVAATTQLFNEDGNVITLTESNVNYPNALTVGEDIVVNLTPVDATAADKTTYTYVSIIGKSNLI